MAASAVGIHTKLAEHYERAGYSCKINSGREESLHLLNMSNFCRAYSSKHNLEARRMHY